MVQEEGGKQLRPKHKFNSVATERLIKVKSYMTLIKINIPSCV